MFQKRILIFLGFIGAIFFVIIARLFSSQVINNSYYLTQARKYATLIELISDPRGKILDRNGNVLVTNKLTFDLFITPFKYFAVEKNHKDITYYFDDSSSQSDLPDLATGQAGIINKLAGILKCRTDVIISKIKAIQQKVISQAEKKTEREKKQFIKQQYRNKYKLFSGLSLEQALQIDAHPDIFPGFNVSETISRFYPYNELACHVIGYTGPIWKEEYQDFVENNYFHDILSPDVDENTYEALIDMGEFKDKFIGRTGVEKLHNKSLIGKYAVRLSEYDYSNKQKRELSRTNSTEPSDVMLTIDMALQKKAEEALKGKTGAVIVMNIHNGEILAMASSPSFNPNLLQPPVDKETAEYITKSPSKPLYNRAISGEYPAGSIFKIITAIAALEEGKITLNTSFHCNGYFSSSYKKFKCWIVEFQREHGSLSLEDGFKNSCNVYFFNIGKLAGGEAITKWGDKMGFGHLCGIELPGENQGRLAKLPVQSDKNGNNPISPTSKWSLSETLNLSIGQGDLMVTPLQIVRMMAALTNGGVLVRPRILKTPVPINTNSTNGTNPTNNSDSSYSPNSSDSCSPKVVLSPDTIKHIQNGLYKVVHSEGGTAYGTKLRDFPVAAKTGTAEVWGHKSHAWVAGFAPYDKPQIAFVVVVEHGGKGSEVSAPIAAAILPDALAIKSSDNQPEPPK
ncbi:MAG: penicillin-binding transpeptidase domain-containing protein [Planctomycetota bacterium]